MHTLVVIPLHTQVKVLQVIFNMTCVRGSGHVARVTIVEQFPNNLVSS